MSIIVPVLLAGGLGNRLWPLSRANYPKQFLKLLDKKHSLLQTTIKRLSGLKCTAPIFICNYQHAFIIETQSSSLGLSDKTFITEPMSKNTAAAVALAALHVQQHYGAQQILLILPVDHYLKEPTIFAQSVETACHLALQKMIVTFGLRPHYPATSYGYIKCAQANGKIAQFVEKPSYELAKSYLQQPDYYWNSGIFAATASTWLASFEKWAPHVLKPALKAYTNAKVNLNYYQLTTANFAQIPAISLDYALMEKATNICMVNLATTWSDVGSWEALWQITEKDSSGNVSIGKVRCFNSRNNYLYSPHKLLVTKDIENKAIIISDDAILVINREKSEQVKDIVATLKKQGLNEVDLSANVAKPWNNYQSLIKNKTWQLKILILNPSERISLQKHHHRSEHWIVVEGIAEVTVADNKQILHQNQHLFISKTAVYTVKNLGEGLLQIVAVQTGAYLAEEAIISFADDYTHNLA